MAVSEKTKEKLDEASKEIKEAIDNLKHDVIDLTGKVKEKLKGPGEEMRKSAEELAKEIRGLTNRVKELVPKKRKDPQVEVKVDRSSEIIPDNWARSLMEFRRATDRLLENYLQDHRWPMSEWRDKWDMTSDIISADQPLVDISETDEDIRVTAELPGVGKDDIELSISNDILTIRGEKREEEEKKERGYYKLERHYGSFKRNLQLPSEVETDKVEASFKDGILIVRLPKTMAAKEKIKKITVRSG